MGGKPLFALNLVFFPDDQLPGEVLAAMMRGGAEAAREAGIPIVGGHTVRDDQVKYGLSVTGSVRADRLLANTAATAGQALVLTKALGTGIIGTAIKNQVATEEEAAAAIKSMTTHNADGLHCAFEHGVTAATDVTGFGLLGHLRNILNGSELTAEIEMTSLPLLPGALEHARAGRVPGGSRANLAFVEPQLVRRGFTTGDETHELQTLLAADAQTSGGLLLCVDESRAQPLVSMLRDHGLPAAAIGQLGTPTNDALTGTTTLVFS